MEHESALREHGRGGGDALTPDEIRERFLGYRGIVYAFTRIWFKKQFDELKRQLGPVLDNVNSGEKSFTHLLLLDGIENALQDAIYEQKRKNKEDREKLGASYGT